jgi:hypothetical protein
MFKMKRCLEIFVGLLQIEVELHVLTVVTWLCNFGSHARKIVKNIYEQMTEIWILHIGLPFDWRIEKIYA